MDGKKFREKFILYKIFYQRSLSYVSLINSAMILYLFLSDLKKYNILISIETWFFPILVLGIFLLILFGYIEDRLGFYRTEQQEVTQRTPQMNSILKKLDFVEKELREIKKKIK
jgi:hypothetical protein